MKRKKRIPRATIDFETRSPVSIKTHGSWRYSLDPHTQILCLVFRLPHWQKGHTSLWHPAIKDLKVPFYQNDDEIEELDQWIKDGEPLEAHNAWFERGIWKNKLIPGYGFRAITDKQWMCSAAKAAAHALPRALDDAAIILGCDELKDDAGSKIMKKMSSPRKPRKAEIELYGAWGYPLPILYHGNRAMHDRLCTYCAQDVLTEEAVSEKLDDLIPFEQKVYCLDQVMNERGFGLDADAIDAAHRVIAIETKRLNAELAKVTNGYITAATERKNILAWCASEDVILPDTTKLTIDDAVANWPLPPKPKRVLEILREGGLSSTAKYIAMRRHRCPDGRAHGGLLYHGAGTGRWSGAGIQPQNFPKGKIKDISAVWSAIIKGDYTWLKANVSPKLMEILSWALRGVIVPTPGKQLYVADYAAIEARVLAWMADEPEMLDAFRTGADMYSNLASDIYGYPCSKAETPKERDLGKVGILGLGYQMGVGRFVDTCWLMARIRIDEEMSRKVVDAYRERYWRIKQLWYDTEEAAIEAVESGKPVKAGKVTYHMTEEDESHYQFLYCTLPSGRSIAYPDPYIRPKRTPWGELRGQLTFMGVNPLNHQWQRQSAYGGLLVENNDQAISRDLMAAACLRCEEHPDYTPILTVHDELIAEAEIGRGDVHEFEQLISVVPAWGAGIPVAAEGWRGDRYRK